MNFMDMSSLFSGNGFGINTNILETNVINLAVVIAVVISFVGDALRELLDNRKKKIFDNIALADARAQEMEQRILTAKNQLETAKQRAMQIREQGILAAEQEKALCISQADIEAARLEQLKDNSLRRQQQKAIQKISQQIVALSVQHAREQVEKRVDGKMFQIWVNKGKMVHYVTMTDDLVTFNKNALTVI